MSSPNSGNILEGAVALICGGVVGLIIVALACYGMYSMIFGIIK